MKQYYLSGSSLYERLETMRLFSLFSQADLSSSRRCLDLTGRDEDHYNMIMSRFRSPQQEPPEDHRDSQDTSSRSSQTGKICSDDSAFVREVLRLSRRSRYRDSD